MNRVDRAIFDALARRQSVYLPEVGYLEVRRRKAKRISETQMIPPQNVVVFTLEQIAGAVSIVDLIDGEKTEGTEKGRHNAQELYKEWLSAASAEGGGAVKIADVGEIRDGRMVETAGSLHDVLNPGNGSVITMKKVKYGRNYGVSALVAWILVGVLSLVIIVCCVCWWMHGEGNSLPFGLGNLTETTARVADAETEQLAEETADVAATGEPAADGTAAETTTAGTSGASSAAAPGSASSASTSGTAVAAPASGYHVIGGTFSIEKNADNFLARVARNYPELRPAKLVQPSTGYWMVSIYSAPTAREAYNAMNKYWDIDLYLWVYKD